MLRFLIALILCISNYSYAANLHAILICDTHAVDLEEGIKQDCRHVQKELNKIAKLTGLTLSMQLIKGKDVNALFLDRVKTLKTGPDDVVVFYYSGHGTRFKSQKDPWPYFDFEYDDPNALSLLGVTKELMKTKARLILSIADCCNDFHDEELLPRKLSPCEVQGYKKLFLEARGIYIASSAKPGESAIGFDEEVEEMDIKGGGFFTNALIETIHLETGNCHDPSWETIFQLATLKTVEYQLRDDEDPVIYHHPQYQRL